VDSLADMLAPALGGRYESVRILGRGSFGTVILTRFSRDSCWSHSRDGTGRNDCLEDTASPTELRVIKQVDLPAVTTDDNRSCAEALHETEVLKSLSHPNIIGYFEAFFDGTCLCIAMEYADGGDLAATIARRRKVGQRFLECEAMTVFAQLVLALQYLHERRILHRDIKSQNVFLMGHRPTVKLGDFGIAKVLRASLRCAATVIGTPYYLPPEMCENEPYDFKADVWCLGVIFYELLALELPFSARSIGSLVVQICSAEPQPVPARYGRETRTILAGMLAKQASNRPSIDEIAALPHVRQAIDTSSDAEEVVERTFGITPKTCTTFCNKDVSPGEVGQPGQPGQPEQCVLRAPWSIDLVEAEKLLHETPAKQPKIDRCSTASLALAELELFISPCRSPKRSGGDNEATLAFLSPRPAAATQDRETVCDTNLPLGPLLSARQASIAPSVWKQRSESNISWSRMLRNLEAEFGFV